MNIGNAKYLEAGKADFLRRMKKVVNQNSFLIEFQFRGAQLQHLNGGDGVSRTVPDTQILREHARYFPTNDKSDILT
jgi:hypothetical protein